MSNNEDEIRDLREKNSELVQEVQFWKVAAAQKEKEKLELMKDVNELRLKLSRIRSGGAAQVRKLDAALQSTTEDALGHLVQASGSIASTLELVKQYMRDRTELDEASPRWASLSGAPTPRPPRDDRVHKVPPLLIGGQSIQPVVSLSRTMLNASTRIRSPNETNNVTQRAIPMRMLQDVYIPLTRIDLEEFENNRDSIENNSVHDLGIEENEEELMNESQDMTESFEASRRLDAVIEETEEPSPNRRTLETPLENPLEGPSWLLDVSTNAVDRSGRAGGARGTGGAGGTGGASGARGGTPPEVTRSAGGRGGTPEPDSTTQGELQQEEDSDDSREPPDNEKENTPMLVFTPTVRRRKRPSSPPEQQVKKEHRNSSRVLKVVLSKMRLSCGEEDDTNDVTPPKRPMKRSLLLPAPRQRRPKETGLQETQGTDLQRTIPHGTNLHETSYQGTSLQGTSVQGTDIQGTGPDQQEAPSPSGATEPRVIISETDRASSSNVNEARTKRQTSQKARGQSKSHNESVQSDRGHSEESSGHELHHGADNTSNETESGSRPVSRVSAGSDMDMDSGEVAEGRSGRSRRPRKYVVYKERPLNRSPLIPLTAHSTTTQGSSPRA